jgi:hypothetical protein
MNASQNTGNQPEKRFSAGAVSVSVWKNEVKNKTGEQVEFRTISLQRAYKDKEDKWQHTNSLRLNDLPKAVLLLNKAYEYLTLRDGAGEPDGGIAVEEIM